MDSVRQIELEQKISRFDKGMKITFAGMIATVIVLLSFIVFQENQTQQQLAQTLVDAKSAGAINHKKTQDLIICVAQALTLQISDRKPAFEKCGLNLTQPIAVPTSFNSSGAIPNMTITTSGT